MSAAVRRAAVAALLAAFVAAPPAGAQQDTVALRKVVQFAIPSSPAFDFIGASPDEVSRPTTPRALVAALASGIDAAGRPQQGLAVEVAPVQLLRPRMDLADYQRPRGFLLANLSVAVGAAQAAGDAPGTSVAVGVRAVLLDRTDPSGPASRAAGDAAITGTLLACLPRGRPVDRADSAEVAAVRGCVAGRDSAFRAAWRRDHWNDYALAVAAATGWGLESSVWKARHGLGGAVWALGAAPLCFRPGAGGLCRHGQWLAKAEYESRDSVEIGRTLSRVTGGVRATLGAAAAAGFAEALFRRHLTDLPDVRRTRREWSAGIEFRVVDAVWASTGIGGRYDDLTADTKAVVLMGLRFNVAQEQRLTALR